MAARSKKEQQQIIILAALFAVILLTIAYTQRAAFLPPAPSPESAVVPETRAAITVKATDQLFEDVRFTSLKNHVDPAVAPVTTGNGALFAVPLR